MIEKVITGAFGFNVTGYKANFIWLEHSYHYQINQVIMRQKCTLWFYHIRLSLALVTAASISALHSTI